MSPSPEHGTLTAGLLDELTLEEKAAITAGSGLFAFTGVPRLGLPDWKCTDGPNGARGSSLLGSGPAIATCIPCGSALGATWDPSLVHELGVLLGRETRTKACRVLLAPTINLHRAPLAGRNFECFSEDPVLSSRRPSTSWATSARPIGTRATRSSTSVPCESCTWCRSSTQSKRAALSGS
jgi:beta-glucosidase